MVKHPPGPRIINLILSLFVFTGLILQATHVRGSKDEAKKGISAIQAECEFRQKIPADEILDRIRTKKEISFDCKEIDGVLEIQSLSLPMVDGKKLIDVPVHINRSIFKDGVNFTDARFNLGADFGGSSFESAATFDGAVFLDEVGFANVEFAGSTSFIETEFDGDGAFVMTHFNKSAVFSNASCVAQCRFLYAQFDGDAFFDEFHIDKAAYFTSAVFSRNAIFTGVRIPNPGVIFDFKGATFDKVVFDLASLRQIYPQDQNEVLQKLEKKFRDQEQLDLANQAYYMRMVFHRNNNNNWLVRAFEIIFLDIPFGYGVRPWRVVGTSLFLILLFAGFYFPPGVIREPTLAAPKPRSPEEGIRMKDPPLARKGEFPDLVQGSSPGDSRSQAWNKIFESENFQRAREAFTFSFGVFTKIRYGNRVAARRQKIVILEWLLGLVMITGFAYTLSKSVPFLYNLVGFMLK